MDRGMWESSTAADKDISHPVKLVRGIKASTLQSATEKGQPEPYRKRRRFSELPETQPSLSKEHARYGSDATASSPATPTHLQINAVERGLGSDGRDVVLVWDVDETLILFHSLINGKYASAHNVEVGKVNSTLHLWSCSDS
jgi:hypothetical protein